MEKSPNSLENTKDSSAVLSGPLGVSLSELFPAESDGPQAAKAKTMTVASKSPVKPFNLFILYLPFLQNDSLDYHPIKPLASPKGESNLYFSYYITEKYKCVQKAKTGYINLDGGEANVDTIYLKKFFVL